MTLESDIWYAINNYGLTWDEAVSFIENGGQGDIETERMEHRLDNHLEALE